MDKLISLKDGDILNFSEEHWASSGCHTCDYGSSYVQDFTVETTKGSFTINVSEMYDYPVSHDYLIKAIVPNVETIKEMTIAEFEQWLRGKINEATV